MLWDIKSLLALITVVFVFAVTLTLFFVQIPTANLDLVKTFGIALISAASLVIGYYFGSSEGSARKTELLAPPATITEILPPSSQAGFIRLRLLILSLLICASLLFAGCAANRTVSTTPAPGDTPQMLAGKSLLAVKSTIIVAETSVDAGCDNGLIKPSVCLYALSLQDDLKLGFDAAIEAYLLMTQGGDPEAFATSLKHVQKLASALLELSGTGGAP